MATNTIYSLRDFRFKFSGDSAFRDDPSYVSKQREITGSNTASLCIDLQLTSNQSALTVNFGDMAISKAFYLETDGSVKLIYNTTNSCIVGTTSAAATVGKPIFYAESSIIAATVTNRINKQTKVKIRAVGVTA